MSSILERASSIISLLGAEPQRRFTVAEVAEACALPPATVTRLLKELCRLGWADQRARRQKYSLGPRAYALGTEQPYRQNIVEHSYPVAVKLAEELQNRIVVAYLRGRTRFSLFEYEPEMNHKFERTMREHHNIYVSAGGRLLLALAKPARQETLIQELGLPKENEWRGILTEKELRDELKILREQKYLFADINKVMSSGVAAFLDSDGVYACIGCHAKRSWWQAHPNAFGQIRQAANVITERIAADSELM